MAVNWIKAAGVAASVVGAVATVVGDWAGKKDQDAKIEKAVAKAMSKAVEKKS